MILLPNAPVAPYASCVYFYFTNDLLSIHHADRQSVDISVTVFVCVCTVTDFSAEDKASGVKFFSAVHRRPRQGITHFCEVCSPEAQNGTIRQCAGRAHPHVNITVEMRQRKRHAGDAPFVKSRPDFSKDLGAI